MKLDLDAVEALCIERAQNMHPNPDDAMLFAVLPKIVSAVKHMLSQGDDKSVSGQIVGAATRKILADHGLEVD